MRCAWQEYIRLLPHGMRKEVDEKGRNTLQELRLRLGQAPRLITKDGTLEMDRQVTAEDISYVINAASQYSPWAAETVSSGYITAPGGHRIGICGDGIVHEGVLKGIRNPTSLCIRVARDFMGIATGILKEKESVLIIGPPGSGKTTLLRDLIRCRSAMNDGSVAVVDERGEIFPFVQGRSCFDTDGNTDILTGVGKPQGLDMLLRTMGPGCIAVDEITKEEDCKALLNAAWNGVRLLATVHASGRNDLINRAAYRPILSNAIFDTVILMNTDKTWKTERLLQWKQK